MAVKCFAASKPPRNSRNQGTFAKIKRGRVSASYNVVSASRVICRQEKSRDEPGAGRDPADGLVPHDP